MDEAQMVKQFVIKVNVIDGSVTYENNDELTFMESLGAIEYVKMMITNQWLEGVKS